MLTVRLLGPIDIRYGGTPLAAAGRDKGLLLLAYLAATAGHSHVREDLADLFWPGMQRERALHNLRQTLLRLRGLLPAAGRMPAYLEADARSIAFNRDADYWLDLEPFLLPYRDIAPEMLEQRAALYRGPFMSDCAGDLGGRFSGWVEERREACHRNALALEETLAAQHESGGRLARALEHAQRCVQLEPWQETGQRRLLRLLAGAGQATSALHHFHVLRAELRRELGSDVDAETLALVERIRRGEVAPIRPAAAPAAGARRRVTALDCGLDCGPQHGDDPEALAAALAQPCRLAREIIEAGGGYLTGCRPNGLSALFGWPQDDERSARNAARAALALREGMARAYPGVRVTIGGESGAMLEREGQNGAWHVAEQAMRLRLTAPAGIAVIGAQLQQRLQTRFELHSLPPTRGQTGAWRLAAEQVCAPPAGVDAFPLLGREAPLALLSAARQAAGSGLRVVLVVGEAGIGKSRLVREFSRAAADDGRLPWCECEARAAGSPLFPVLRMLRQALDLPLGADAAAVQRRLGAILAPAGGGAAARLLVPLFCPQETAFDPQQKSGILHALCELLARLAQPAAALVLEDIHWSDATTLELLDLLARRHAGPGLLLVLTARRPPPLPAALAQRAETLALAPLDAGDAARLAAAASANGGASGAQIAAAWRAAEGVPLFIVELARMQAAAPGGGSLPATLHDLLAARLEQAGDGKALLQAAAVIGREFSVAHLRRLMADLGGMARPLAETLARLAAANLLEHDGAHANGARFSHALLQRAAYESLPSAHRAELHRRYAAVLQDQPAAPAAAAAIAWHLAAGGLAGEAAEWWLRAARQASHMAAYTETAQLAERALATLAAAGGASARDGTELGALLLAAYARVALGGYFDGAAQALYGRARALLHGRDADARQTLGVLRGHWLGASSRASYREARAIAGEFIMIADAAGLECLRGVGRYLAGNSMLWLGEFEAALPLLEEAVAILARAPADSGVLAAHDQDFEATATGYLGWVHWYLGRPQRALALGRRAVELARQRGHLLTLLHTSMTFCCIAMGNDAAEEVRAAAEEMTRRAQARKLAMWADVGRLLRHWALAQLGRKTSSAAGARALDRLGRVYPGGAAGFQAIFAAACLARGELESMAGTLAALDLSLRATEAHAFGATRHLLAAQLAWQQRRPRAAAASLRRAIRTAAAQGSPMLEMQAWAALCQLSPSRANRAGLAAAGSRCAEPGMPPPAAPAARQADAASRSRLRQEPGAGAFPMPF